ncbi:Arc family DNA-binding protein [Xenorhabdus bovienii]|uniref:Arc family DNA-binding protein n=1 Tax=Xenorhabdus bovienii TaxID=40576 RepID=UPI00237C76D5|nr:Arc family DNA-binding protein [Xenorhabdus bovienii]MDE1487403.1 Arc family DNA-binding protein [Xenorhabdus bovienii]MDE9478423.1 Arc family DNA-binding protein [Xenorhabdus bovienii]MDE9531305.1 Arc family DNA-binding protein [Xenorhabdus bovienii]MDE9570620.1 Arc family DNA-binding protein [Xenorhabdus bovienii]
MSREDPQLRIRLPIELKEKIEETAKANSRSMNAEIVQRLDISFLNEPPTGELISAKDAAHIASKAKKELSVVILKRTFNEINKKIRMGHKSFCIMLDDLELEGLEDEEFNEVFQQTFNRLNDLGYTVLMESLDADGFLVDIK